MATGEAGMFDILLSKQSFKTQLFSLFLRVFITLLYQKNTAMVTRKEDRYSLGYYIYMIENMAKETKPEDNIQWDGKRLKQLVASIVA